MSDSAKQDDVTVHDEIEVSENHCISESGWGEFTEYEVHTGMADEYPVSESLAQKVKEQYGLDLENGNYLSGCEVIVVPDDEVA